MISEKEIEALRKKKALLPTKLPLLLEKSKEEDEPITHKEWKHEIKRVSALLKANKIKSEICPICKERVFSSDLRSLALVNKNVDLFNRENPKLNRVYHKCINVTKPTSIGGYSSCTYKSDLNKIYFCDGCCLYHEKEVVPYKVYVGDDGDRAICDSSFRGIAMKCTKCGKYFRANEGSGSTLCFRCVDQLIVNGYGYKPKAKFIVTEEEKNTKRFFGMEYEVGITVSNAEAFMGRINKNATHNTFENLCYLKHDGSISGFEVVTHPHSLSALKFFVTQNLLPTLSHYNHSFNNCGIHIHVSKKSLSKATIIKLCLLFNNVNHDDEIKLLCQLFKRTSENLQRWSRTTYSIPSKSDMVKYSKTNSQNYIYNGNKYIACNLNHRDTVEFRMFGGTDDEKTILSFIEMIDGAINFCEMTPYSKITIKNWLDFMFSKYKIYPNTYSVLKNNSLFSQITRTKNDIDTLSLYTLEGGYPILSTLSFKKCLRLLQDQLDISDAEEIQELVYYYNNNSSVNAKFYISTSLLQMLERVVDGRVTCGTTCGTTSLPRYIKRWVVTGESFSLGSFGLSTSPQTAIKLCEKHKEIIKCA